MIGNFPYLHIGCYGGWQRWAHRPVTDLFIGNHSDGFLMKMGDEWKIWYTHVQNGKIHVAASDDGFAWRYMSLADHPFVNEGGDYRCAHYPPCRSGLGLPDLSSMGDSHRRRLPHVLYRHQ